MSRIPQQVQQAGERSNALIEQLRNPNPSTAAVDPPPVAPPDSQGGAPEANEWQRKYLEVQHRLTVIQGKYNAEVPRYAARQKELEAQVQALTAENATLRTAAAAPGAAAAHQQPAANPVPDLSEFDPPLAAAITTAVAAQVAPIQQELKARQDSDAQAQAELARQERWNQTLDRLDILVPGWDKIDKDPAFQEWCVAVDAVTKVQRQEELTAAVQAMDAAGIAVFYQSFLAANPAIKPQQPDTRLAEKQVPSPSGRDAPPATDKKTYTRQQVSDFYSNVARGAYKHEDPARLKAIEADMTAAFREGRIIG